MMTFGTKDIPPSRQDEVRFGNGYQTLRVWLPSGCAFGTRCETADDDRHYSFKVRAGRATKNPRSGWPESLRWQ
jgi:hypothetical protein